MTPTTYGRDFAYCLKSHGGVRGFNASLWRFLLRCTLFCHSVATFLTSVSSYEGGCGFEVRQKRDEVPEGTLSCPDRNLAVFHHYRHYEGLRLLPSVYDSKLIQQTLIRWHSGFPRSAISYNNALDNFTLLLLM